MQIKISVLYYKIVIKYHFLILFVLTFLTFLKFCASTVGGSSVNFYVVVKASEVEGS